MGDIAIRAEGLGKRFNLNLEPHLSFKETAAKRLAAWGRGLRTARRELLAGRWPKGPLWGPSGLRDFWALKDISFELRYGEVMGLIGNNGAGKSTLMKILSQVIAPTEGRAELHGRIGALLEVGIGFNPELTGRENIYLYGAVLGMDQAAISRRFDEIVEFAEIADFLEEPIKHYSSGMYARLGFSVAVHLECDVLLVDEVLSVGDATFTVKCQEKMREVTRQGRAVVFVSHGMNAVSNMCDTAMVMKEGRITYTGATEGAIRHYMQFVRKKVSIEQSNPTHFPMDESKPVQFTAVSLCNEQGALCSEFEREDRIVVVYDLLVRRPVKSGIAVLSLLDERNNTLVQSIDSDVLAQPLNAQKPGEYQVKITLPKSLFQAGRYYVTPCVRSVRGDFMDKHEHLLSLMVEDPPNATAKGVGGLIWPDIGWEYRQAGAAAAAPPAAKRARA